MKWHNMLSKIFIILSLIFFVDNTAPDSLKKEVYYQDLLVNYFGGETEYRLTNGCRIDILTDKYAIEIDFAEKWSQFGQALYYAGMTKKIPGVVLILKDENDKRFVSRLLTASTFVTQICIWTIDVDGNIEDVWCIPEI